MHIKRIFLLVLLSLCVSSVNAHDDDVSSFHAFRLEFGAGESRDSASVLNWNIDGWTGGNTHKFRFKSEGEIKSENIERSENWVLYSYSMSTFWDAQTGIRYDSAPASTGYFVVGVAGLASYFIETELHGLVGEGGNMRLRFHAEKDFLLTQRLVLQPGFELNASAQEVDELHIGSGLTDSALSLQLRYEITRKLAPYVEFKKIRLFGDTEDMAEARGDHRSDSIITAGVRLLF